MKTYTQREDGTIICTVQHDGVVDEYAVTLESMQAELQSRQDALLIAQAQIDELNAGIAEVEQLGA